MSAGRGLRLVVAAQCLGAVADGALVLVAIQLLHERAAPGWTVPALRVVFYAGYVLLAAFAGAAADAWPKQRVLVATGGVKLAGCCLLLGGVHPLLAYAFVGLGAVTHGPARYGILAELVPPGALVAANGWMEAATVIGSLLGIVLAGALLAPAAGAATTTFGAAGTGWTAAAVLAVIYLLATLACAPVPARAAADPRALRQPGGLVARFTTAAGRLAADRDALAAVAVTSLFWSAAAVLQFLVLRWAAEQLGLPLSRAALLQAVFGAGLVAGAIAAGRWVPAGDALRVLPAGLGLGAGLVGLAFVGQAGVAAALLAVLGVLAGLLLVPMNALLQSRGATLVEPGQAIAVQQGSEHLASIVLLAAYGVLTALDAPVRACLVALGALVASAAALLWTATRGTRAKAARGRPSA